MKNLCLSVLAGSMLLISCSQKPEIVDNSITIQGKLENSEFPLIMASLDEDLASDSVQSDGTFRLKFDYPESGMFLLTNGDLRFSLYLNPGDSIFITGDAKEFGQTFMASGDKAKENAYLRKKFRAINESGLDNFMETMALKKEAYFSRKDSLISIVKQNYDSLIVGKDIDPVFSKMEESYFTYQSLFMDQMYPLYHSYINKIPQDSVDFPVEDTKSKLNELPLDQKELLGVAPYKNLLDQRINNLAGEMMKADTTIKEYEKVSWMAIDSLIKNPEIKDQLKFETLKSTLEYRGPVHVEDMYSKFLAENTTPKFAEKLEKLKAKWDPISPGKTVPDFTFTDIKGDSVKLSDLKGNLVYIDIWATWCGPCIAEHPNWDKVKEEYKDKPVAFLTVSIDDTREPWEKMVKNKKMDGLQWFASNAWQSELAQFFMVNAIPRFLLLDQEGKIIDPSAERPSGNIREVLDKHLEKAV
ncbi:TlpA family protein disulfide reductase [Aquiflexum gelatinilyticum]|uniref:TlpA family protein disulfide reductase n=1 Tax=Aquiflexum gelatinilyticum TaxID=2961943 RepID=UPI0021673CE5|nr:TlpA disulfide reductase family protein [Aquiflexum gelatinilyticum]MCS4433053.1 TlpA family protein disulfide reductase [Aquiflexum gelatinilyticum]